MRERCRGWVEPLRVVEEPLLRWVLGLRVYRGTSLIRNRPPPLRPPQGPRRRPTVGSWGEAFSYEPGTPVPPRRERFGGRVVGSEGRRGR